LGEEYKWEDLYVYMSKGNTPASVLVPRADFCIIDVEKCIQNFGRET
jgi:hypothetical protein